MELFDNLALGFSHAVTLPNIGYAFIGCLLGDPPPMKWSALMYGF